jgi:TonB family protein
MTKLRFPSFALFIVLMLFGNSFGQVNSLTDSTMQSVETVYKQSKVDQKAKIIKKLIPSTDRMCDYDNGFVRVRVVLLKSGKVGDVESLKSSRCNHFNENSLDSAREIKFSISNEQTNDSSKSAQKKDDNNSQPDRDIQIKAKPAAEVGNCRLSSGVVILKVTFDKSAKIGNVEVAAPSGCKSFDRNAAWAAKGIKFKPAVKNGEAITVTKQVQYTFAYITK